MLFHFKTFHKRSFFFLYTKLNQADKKPHLQKYFNRCVKNEKAKDPIIKVIGFIVMASPVGIEPTTNP